MTDSTDVLAEAGMRADDRGSRASSSRYRRLLSPAVIAGLVVAAVLAAPAGPSHAALAVTAHQRQIVKGASAVSSATFSLTVPAGVNTVAGRHLVLTYLFSGTAGDSVTAVTDSKGNAYRTDVVKSNAGTSGLKVVIVSARITAALSAGDTVTVTQSTSTTYHVMQLYEFDNLAPTSWTDRTATGNGATANTAVSTSAATTTQASETVVTAVGAGDAPTTLTSGAGWTDLDAAAAGSPSKQKTVAVAVKDVTATGSYAYSGTLSAADQWVAALVTYRTVDAGTEPPIGFEDMSTAGSGGAASGEKPTSKLWFSAGSWWGVLFDAVSQTHHIFRLDRATQTWTDTGVRVDDRARSRSDALWDGQHLYIASAMFAASSTASAPGNPARLYRYRYDTASATYVLDGGFPVTISDYSAEALTIDKDSTGVLWATWVQNTQVYVNRSLGSESTWGEPFVLPVAGSTALDPDDISALAAFGNKVGVMWSNQAASAMFYAIHQDGDADTTWQPGRTAVQGPNSADDHINLKALQGDAAGRLFAAVKTSLDDGPGHSDSAPQILVLARDPATGDWSSAPFGRISDCHTRPVLMLDSQRQVLHVFATAPDTGCPFSGSAGTIFEKTSPMSTISFPLGRGTPVIRDAASPNLNNVTSSKQSVSDATGLIVVATNDVTKRYWHADVPLQ